MNFGLHELLTSCLALAVLPVFFLAPGYLLASATNLMDFQRQSWIERLLWACALSQPVSLLFTVHPGLAISPQRTSGCFLAIAAVALALVMRDAKRTITRTTWDRDAFLVLAAAVWLVPYVLLSVFPLEIHGRIYESAVWQDWNVRIQLVNAAIRGGTPPGNPMFAIAGHPPALHYYYFWYVLCARMHDLAPVSARAILTVSCVGASLSLLAFLLLAVKYLSPSPMPTRRQCSAAMLVACILGLDLIAALITLSYHRFYSDLQFWLNDRSPGFLHMVIWSPHHVAGLVCCGLGTLLFVRSLQVPRAQQVVHSVLAALCFAASVGTSSFITLLFALACAVLFVDALHRREWPVPLTMIGATVLAALLVTPFLRQILPSPGNITPDAVPGIHASLAAEVRPIPPSGHFFTFAPRYKDQATGFVWHTLRLFDSKYRHRPLPGEPNYIHFHWIARFLRQPYSAGMCVFDFGFFLFVFVYQVRKDFLTPSPMSRASRVLWLLFAAIAIPGFFITSEGLQANNDFGRHAGFCLRIVFLIWAAPLVAEFLSRWKQAKRAHTPLRLATSTRWALSFAVIGLLGQLAQIALVRLRFPLTDAGLLPQVVVQERLPHPAFRFGQVQRAMAAAAAITPPDGIVQGNPHSRLAYVFLLYTNRQMAASDDGCNFPFGGNVDQCLPMTDALIRLFGGMGPRYHGMQGIFLPDTIRFDAAAVTPANFARNCSQFKLDTLVANYTDPAWWDPQSWIWQLHPSFANSTARVFSCRQPVPSASPAPPPTASGAVVH